jgi:hypothetical protein
MAGDPMDEFGPAYPALPSVDKYRRQRDPDVKAYGQAVREAVRVLQRQELERIAKAGYIAGRKPNCASGTWHTTGPKIRKAIREQHRAQNEAAANAQRRNRSDEMVMHLYKEAMAAKRG